MTIVDAIGKACGILGAGAYRPTGLLVTVTRRGGLRRPTAKGSLAFQPGLQDVVADDWEVMTPEQTAAVVETLRAPAEASA